MMSLPARPSVRQRASRSRGPARLLLIVRVWDDPMKEGVIMVAKKASRKAAGKKKAAKKVARKKTASRKKASKKKASRKKTTKGKKSAKRSAFDFAGIELPKSLKALGRQVRRDLNSIEKQIEVCGKDTRRSLARVVRDASHQLGLLEARGEREWRSLSRNSKRDVERVMRRVRKAAGA
jgi:hypothetical protein